MRNIRYYFLVYQKKYIKNKEQTETAVLHYTMCPVPPLPAAQVPRCSLPSTQARAGTSWCDHLPG